MALNMQAPSPVMLYSWNRFSVCPLALPLLLARLVITPCAMLSHDFGDLYEPFQLRARYVEAFGGTTIRHRTIELMESMGDGRSSI